MSNNCNLLVKFGILKPENWDVVITVKAVYGKRFSFLIEANEASLILLIDPNLFFWIETLKV